MQGYPKADVRQRVGEGEIKVNKLRIETTAQIMRDKSKQNNYDAFKDARDTFAYCAFSMITQGRLYCKNSKGEIVKVEVKL